VVVHLSLVALCNATGCNKLSFFLNTKRAMHTLEKNWTFPKLKDKVELSSKLKEEFGYFT
jgi:hypothetical protein